MPFDRDQRTSLEVFGMFFQHRKTHRDFTVGWQFHQPNDATVELLLEDGQSSEILVASDNDPLLFISKAKNLFVTRIARPVADKLDIVTVRPQGRGQAHACAGFHQQFHGAGSVKTGSMRSLPTARLA